MPLCFVCTLISLIAHDVYAKNRTWIEKFRERTMFEGIHAARLLWSVYAPVMAPAHTLSI